MGYQLPQENAVGGSVKSFTEVIELQYTVVPEIVPSHMLTVTFKKLDTAYCNSIYEGIFLKLRSS